MRYKKFFSFIPIAILLVSVCLSCSLLPGQGINYDPSKNYAAFLVLDNDTGRSSLATMKQHSADEKLEIGPIEFYKTGTKDFSPILKKLTASKQVTVVWIISSVWDVPDIKKGMEGLEYVGPYRYVPIAQGTGAIKIQP
jgi:hypothetical protein